MKLLGLNTVLVLSPHPDDAEYSLSGAVAKYTDTNFYILTLSSGGNFDDTTGNDRCWEVDAYWSHFPNAFVLGSLNSVIDVKEDHIVHQVDQYFRRLQFDGVMCPPQLDTHFEHRMINNVAKAVCRFGSKSLIEYNTPSTLNDWVPNLFVDVTDFLDTKINLLRGTFATQADRHYFSKDVICDFHSDFFCSKRGYGKVEKFKVDFFIV